jgi:hypothetical protein
MSTGAILTVLANIPWGQVVDNAPRVASGAAKLWTAVTSARKQSAGADPDATAASNAQAPSELQALQVQVHVLQETVAQLQEQMQASSEVIRALADQNTQLVRRVELNRVRLVRLATVAAVSIVLVLSAVAYLGQMR